MQIIRYELQLKHSHTHKVKQRSSPFAFFVFQSIIAAHLMMIDRMMIEWQIHWFRIFLVLLLDFRWWVSDTIIKHIRPWIDKYRWIVSSSKRVQKMIRLNVNTEIKSKCVNIQRLLMLWFHLYYCLNSNESNRIESNLSQKCNELHDRTCMERGATSKIDCKQPKRVGNLTIKTKTKTKNIIKGVRNESKILRLYI